MSAAWNRFTHFYPRSPCGERPLVWCFCGGAFGFLSTLSLRRATATIETRQMLKEDFYPRSPCGERRRTARPVGASNYFYPRSPCGERRYRRSSPLTSHSFLSTLSLRRATLCLSFFVKSIENFYPRSPCGERLIASCYSEYLNRYFYPRSPCGERQLEVLYADGPTMHFYPRSPCGERRL